jgi:hypothetical protein
MRGIAYLHPVVATACRTKCALSPGLNSSRMFRAFSVADPRKPATQQNRTESAAMRVIFTSIKGNPREDRTRTWI